MNKEEMPREIIVNYLVIECGITSGPWKAIYDTFYDDDVCCLSHKIGPTVRGQFGEIMGFPTARVVECAFESLCDWILTAWGMEGVIDFSCGVFNRARKNVESMLGKDWSIVKEDLRRIQSKKQD